MEVDCRKAELKRAFYSMCELEFQSGRVRPQTIVTVPHSTRALNFGIYVELGRDVL
jgi:hypothetical protein